MMRHLSESCLGAALVLAWCALAAPAAAQPQQLGQKPTGVRDLACGAMSPLTAPLPAIRVLGGNEPRKTQWGPGETVRIGAGTAQGVQVGQEYFVRRLVADRFTEPKPKFFPVSVHTVGWLKIAHASTDTAEGTIIFGCGDSVQEGDYLEAYNAPAEPSAGAAGEPDFAHPGHLILADERRQLGAPGVLMVLDRGSDHGVKPGHRLTIFRAPRDGGRPIVVGTATAMVIRPDTSLIRIETVNDAIYVGDLVAIHR